METSAKNATNVEQAFMAMAAAIKNRYFGFNKFRCWIVISVWCLMLVKMEKMVLSGWPANRQITMPGHQQFKSVDSLSIRRLPAAHLK